jgi:hypothetical protein
MSSDLAYLGVLAAQTAQGRRAVAVSLTGAIEAHHVVDAGFLSGSEQVKKWLWSVGINPAEAASSLDAESLVHGVIVPTLGRTPLVVSHADMDVPLVAMLVHRLGRMGSPAIVSGLAPSGPLAEAVNGAAGRRAFALQAAYEAALEQSRSKPAAHVLDGKISEDGSLAGISVEGPFAHASWTLAEADDATFVMLSLAGLAANARFVVKEGPAASALRREAAEAGLLPKMAA